ncbi:MAG: WbqC family protein [Pirellulaceae bacterium]
MRLAIMQPYFLPYLGYFSLIAAADHFVVFDPVQYIRHGWINRNRILKPGFAEPQYIKIPLAKHSRGTLIRDIRISLNTDWKARIFAQIQHYKKKAPYFEQAREILESCLEPDTDDIVKFNVHCLKTVCAAVGIEFAYSSFGEIRDEVEQVTHPGEWALHISSALKATTYINPRAGIDIFDQSQFVDRGVELCFLENSLSSYSQRNQEFVAGLSIMDVLMFNSLEETKTHINDYSLLSYEECC